MYAERVHPLFYIILREHIYWFESSQSYKALTYVRWELSFRLLNTLRVSLGIVPVTLSFKMPIYDFSCISRQLIFDTSNMFYFWALTSTHSAIQHKELSKRYVTKNSQFHTLFNAEKNRLTVWSKCFTHHNYMTIIRAKVQSSKSTFISKIYTFGNWPIFFRDKKFLNWYHFIFLP